LLGLGAHHLSSATYREKYVTRAIEARTASQEMLCEVLGVEFVLTEISGRMHQEMTSQWTTSRFDWPEILRRHRNDADRLDVAVWCGDRLSGVFFCTLSGEAVVLRWVEGDPRTDCPLRGQRLLIALDVATNYAQRNGRYEIRAEPINARLINLFEQDYGFTPVKPRTGAPYWSKKVG
jgi:hypothetical protein